jgi:uncharacterized protein involved in response to NO
VLLLVLAALWSCDAAFLSSLARGDDTAMRLSLLLAVDVILILVTVIGGRIVPAFTGNALRARGVAALPRGPRWLERVVVLAMLGVLVCDLVAPWRPAAGVAAAIAALAQATRLAGWQGARTLHEPLLWSLHLGYAWLPAGLALKAVHLLAGASWSAYWLHALTVGVAGSMVLAVMTRAALGHTGRALAAARPIAVAYGMLSLAALARVFAPVVAPERYRFTILIAGALWLTAFGLYLVVYAPILARPRVDGRPG